MCLVFVHYNVYKLILTPKKIAKLPCFELHMQTFFGFFFYIYYHLSPSFVFIGACTVFSLFFCFWLSVSIETVSKPSRPPLPSQVQLAKLHRRRPPPPVRAMTLSGIPKAVEVARARAKLRTGSVTDASESQFFSVRHLVSPPPVEPRAAAFSFDKNQRDHRARSFSPECTVDNDAGLAAANKVRKRNSLSPDSGTRPLLKPAEEASRKDISSKGRQQPI